MISEEAAGETDRRGLGYRRGIWRRPRGVELPSRLALTFFDYGPRETSVWDVCHQLSAQYLDRTVGRERNSPLYCGQGKGPSPSCFDQRLS